MEKKKVFVIMPFQDQFFEVYETLKIQFTEHFDFSNANDEGNPQNIMKDTGYCGECCALLQKQIYSYLL